MNFVRICAVVMIGITSFAPDRPPEKKPEPAPVVIPQIEGECQYGVISQVGRRIAINGDTWDASGEIRADGKSMFLLWTLKSSGAPAPSVYRFEGGIIGLWGWGEDAILDDEGNLHGRNLRSDTLQRVEVKPDLGVMLQ